MESVIQPEVLERYKEEMRAFARRAGYTLDPPEAAPAAAVPRPAEGAGVPGPIEGAAPVPAQGEAPTLPDSGAMPPAENPAGPPGEQFPLFPVEPMGSAGDGEPFDDGL